MLAVDVLIVGYGPVGQLLSIQLAQRGVRVAVVERWAEPYRMPRAVSYDDEAARILAAAGVFDPEGEFTELTRDYLWRNATGRALLSLQVPIKFRSGWPQSTSVYQPGLEERLAELGTGYSELWVFRSHEAVVLIESPDSVYLKANDRVGGTKEFTAKWVVGCDGANSFVRSHMDVPSTDLDFVRDWMICDVVFDEQREFRPNNLQVCDPSRPRTSVSAGPGHRRCEFMRIPKETREEFASEENMWRMLALFDVRKDNATLARHAVYTTAAVQVDDWRRGRLLLAGDSAHVMPPFMGQGMCSGFRDATNLSWKLAMIIAGTADESILDTYTVERRPHVRRAIEVSVNAGNVICETSRSAAAGRDAYMFAAQRRGETSPPSAALAAEISGGLTHDSAGQLTPQGLVRLDGRTGLFDQVVGNTGFVLLTLDPYESSYLDSIGASVLRVDDAFDVEGVYTEYLAGLGARAALIRPDYYLFGSAATAPELDTLVADLRGRLAAVSMIAT